MITYLIYKTHLDTWYLEDIATAFLITPLTLLIDIIMILFQPIFIIIYLKFKDDLR